MDNASAHSTTCPSSPTLTSSPAPPQVHAGASSATTRPRCALLTVSDVLAVFSANASGACRSARSRHRCSEPSIDAAATTHGTLCVGAIRPASPPLGIPIAGCAGRREARAQTSPLNSRMS
eukprot:scaffold5014_cov387-Prasinococcus_capsulatus_cf.AAC.9